MAKTAQTLYSTELDKRHAAISPAALLDEETAVNALLSSIDYTPDLTARIKERAEKLVQTLRDNPEIGLDAFLQEYSLSHKEGVLIMCLAEALLRIPDTETASRLIRDKFADAEWENHLGKSDSFLVNASTWGLMLSGKVIHIKEGDTSSPLKALKKLVKKSGEPIIRQSLTQAMKIMGQQFILGRDIEEGLENARKMEKRGYLYSYDILGEGARSMEYANWYRDAYLAAIEKIGASTACKSGDNMTRRPGISIKLSALHPRYEFAQEERVMHELTAQLKPLLLAAKKAGIITAIDAEEMERLDISLKVFEHMFKDADFADYEGIGLVVQAYQKRAPYVIHWLAELSKAVGKQIPVRLVKGAYWDTEIKRGQVLGLPTYPVFTRKNNTDLSYIACAQSLLNYGKRFYPQFATHNAHTMACIVEMAPANAIYEFQRLHGMGENLHDQVVQDEKIKVTTRIYAPIGKHEDLLPYLVRRILENGANTSFINRLADKDAPLSEVIADPVTSVREQKPHANPDIPLPRDIYGNGRVNSLGVDLGNASAVLNLYASLDPFRAKTWNAVPLIAGRKSSSNTQKPLHNPADHTDMLGSVVLSDESDIKHAIEAAYSASVAWNSVPVATRAHMLRNAADSLESRMAEAIVLLIREGGKTMLDAISEVRETVDYCRFYANEAERHMGTDMLLPGPTGESNTLSLHGRGVFVCISPWNFPLAIFTGQVVAALAAGNTVIAKPAEQTPLVAAFMVSLLHEAGIPKEALTFLPAKGSMIGNTLLTDARVAGVAFTGSTDTAQLINRTLAARNAPIAALVAETGGQNCMVVDSSALPEQVVDDVIRSAFHSAGQRCSALRVLFVQDDIANKVIGLLKGATQELKIGNPWNLSSDIGPVIDEGAQKTLNAHIEQMRKSATFICQANLPESTEQGTFVAPAAFEIPDISLLKEEVFGPVLHVVRFKANELRKVIDAINSTGFGLTLGIHSRIAQTYEEIAHLTRVGNVYVNRGMTGAVVGVQPFGGEGLSGTGPKAGGPHYLLRFTSEKTLTINTAAIGGNIELFS